jgi:hypothetical protein
VIPPVAPVRAIAWRTQPKSTQERALEVREEDTMFVEQPSKRASLAEAKHALGRGSKWLDERGRQAVGEAAGSLWAISRKPEIPFPTRVAASQLAALLDATVTLSDAATWAKRRLDQVVEGKGTIARVNSTDTIVASAADGAMLGSAHYLCRDALTKALRVMGDPVIGASAGLAARHLGAAVA